MMDIMGRNNIESPPDRMRQLVGISRKEAISSIRTRRQASASKTGKGKHFYIMKVIYIIGIYILHTYYKLRYIMYEVMYKERNVQQYLNRGISK
jgi:hypothetical protein